MLPVSATTFIRNAFAGGFPIFESMATMLALPIEEFVVLDVGSDDGTRAILQSIAEANPRVRVIDTKWSKIDAAVFADIANDCVAACKHDRVLFYQADEVWHPNLLPQIVVHWEAGRFDLSFWRIQLRKNFHQIKWFPHFVHRCVVKGQSLYVGDGMNTNRTHDAVLCSSWNGGWFSRWSDEFKGRESELPWEEFVFDIGASFRDNQAVKRALHAPFWHEPTDVIEGKSRAEWEHNAASEAEWTSKTTPFRVPKILQGCVGMTTYTLRPDLLDALRRDDVKGLVV